MHGRAQSEKHELTCRNGSAMDSAITICVLCLTPALLYYNHIVVRGSVSSKVNKGNLPIYFCIWRHGFVMISYIIGYMTRLNYTGLSRVQLLTHETFWCTYATKNYIDFLKTVKRIMNDDLIKMLHKIIVGRASCDVSDMLYDEWFRLTKVISFNKCNEVYFNN